MEEEDDPVNVFMSLDRWGESPTEGDDEELTQSPLSSPSDTETYMVGFVIVKIVGLQHYNGTLSGREMVGLVREPMNPFDGNAIKVINSRTQQVGHLEKSAAAVLAPLMDANLVTIEGIVPNTPGGTHRYRMPCQVHIFAQLDSFPRVKSEISNGGLQLISDSDHLFTLSEAVIVKEKKGVKGFKSMDEIFKLAIENVNKQGALESMEPPKDVIKSELFLHQKEALGWLVRREDSNQLPPFWEQQNGSYLNVLTNYQTNKQPEPLRGGIFADDMGLGKTLTLLSLIALDKYNGNISGTRIDDHDSVKKENVEKQGEEDDKLIVWRGKKSRKCKVNKKVTATSKKRKIDHSPCADMGKENYAGASHKSSVLVSKTTLIVCPPSVFSSWLSQLFEHTKSKRLKAYMYYGNRTEEAEELRTYDIVLTTYSTLVAEESWPESPVKRIEWWRVILDEAHLIKNVNAQQSRAVTNLKAKRRWVVTGTPIQNGTFDLFSLMAFLRFEPFSIKSYWQSFVERPLGQGNEEGLSCLQLLMATISLRRTKDKGLIGLPLKSVENYYVELSGEEREMYDQMEAEGKCVIRGYIDAESVTRNYSTVLGIILRLRQICTDVALWPSGLRTLLLSNDIEDVSNNPELLKKMVSALQDGEDFDCPICISPPTNIVITCCAHIFCRACILKTLKRSQTCCPLCRHHLTPSDLFSAPPESSETVSSSVTTSSKVLALLKFLSESRDQKPTTKSVVFSQFRKMLMLLEEPLKAAGFKTLRLDGAMNAKKRAKIIEEFGVPGPDSPTVLLASLKASGAGVNLTAASRVYLLEPWWNPAVEEQAMDRVHRIGQKEDVKVVRLIAQNSIEERILELQERKKKLAKEAFGKRDLKDRREIGANDLRMLMSL